MNFPRPAAFPSRASTRMINPLNFSDMGYDVTGPQVARRRRDLERDELPDPQALIDKYDASFPADDDELQALRRGRAAAAGCPGNRRWMQLVFDAMLLMPTNPTMLAGA